MRTLRIGMVGILALAGMTACGDDGGSDGATQNADVFFAVETADAAAHDALPTPTDLGTGWEVTTTDEFDDSDDGAEFETLAADEPACESLTALAGMGGFFGDDDGEELPAGRANVSMMSAPPDALVPTEADFEVEIEETVAEVQAGSNIAKELIEGDDFNECMLAVMPNAFAEQDLPEGASVDIATRQASAQAPNDGVTMAYDIDMDLGAVQFAMALEIYMWSYGNARASAMFVGDQDTLNAELIEPALTAFQQNLADAAA